jgi:membrane protein DedA with SNARE-associated domain
MSYWHFQLANFTSAFVWAGMLLGIGDVVTIVFEWVMERMGGAL